MARVRVRREASAEGEETLAADEPPELPTEVDEGDDVDRPEGAEVEPGPEELAGEVGSLEVEDPPGRRHVAAVPAQRDVGSPTVTVTPFTQRPSIAVDDSEASAALRKVLDYGTPSAAPAVVPPSGQPTPSARRSGTAPPGPARPRRDPGSRWCRSRGFRVLRAAGIRYMQGYLFARPGFRSLPDFTLPDSGAQAAVA